MAAYFYLIWSLIFFAVWVIFFFIRKDTRKEMFLLSIWFGLGGLVCEKTNIQDWWHPLTITGTPIGVEDFLIGFSIGGIAAIIFEEVCRKKTKKITSKPEFAYDAGFYFMLFPVLYLSSFFIFDLGSFYSAVIAYGLSISCMIFLRKDLLKDSLVSGTLLLIIGIGIYLVLFLIYPSYIHQFWYLKDVWYSNLLFGIPIGEYIWFFLTGAYIGPMYEFLRKRYLVALK